MLVTINNFTGGINDTSPPDMVSDNELVSCINLIPFDGGLKYRGGTTALNSASYGYNVTQSFEWKLNNGSVKNMAVINKQLCEISDTNGTKTVKQTIVSDAVAWVPYKNVLFFIDGSKYYMYGYFKFISTDGTVTLAVGDIVKHGSSFYKSIDVSGSVNLGTQTYTDTLHWSDVTDSTCGIPNDVREVIADSDATNDLSPIKKCKYMALHNAGLRFFFAGNPDDPTALYFSEIDSPNFVKKTNILYPNTAAGAVTGLEVFMKSVLVCYKTAWYVWNGIDVATDVTWKQIAVPAGCVANEAKCLTPTSLTFVSNDDIWIMSSGLINDDVIMTTPQSLLYNVTDKKISNLMRTIAHRETIQMVYHENYVYIAYGDDPQTTTNNKVLVMDWNTRTFTVYDGWQVNGWNKRGNGTLMFASLNYILSYNSGINHDINTADGTNKGIRRYAKTKAFAPAGDKGLWYPTTVTKLFVAAPQSLAIENVVKIGISSGYYSSAIDMELNQTINDINMIESLVWGRTWNKIWGYTDYVSYYFVTNKKAMRHSVVVETDSTYVSDEETTAPNVIYSFGLEFNPLELEATHISGGVLAHDLT